VSDQRWFRTLKGMQLVAAAAIPVVATLDAPAVVTGTLGAAIVVIEGFQQLNQHQQNWVSYRSTAEALKHEKYLYQAGAGPYEQARSPAVLLANRVEGLISQEHAIWLEAREQADPTNPETRAP
jgi:hypothetical protein